MRRRTEASVDHPITNELWFCNGSQCRRHFQNPRRSDAPRDLPTTEPRRRADRPCIDRFCRRLATGGVETSGRAQAGWSGARPPPRARNPLQRRTKRACSPRRLDRPVRPVLARPVWSPRISSEQDGHMTDAAETRSLVIEKELPHPLEKVWRALAQPLLIEE